MHGFTDELAYFKEKHQHATGKKDCPLGLEQQVHRLGLQVEEFALQLLCTLHEALARLRHGKLAVSRIRNFHAKLLGSDRTGEIPDTMDIL